MYLICTSCFRPFRLFFSIRISVNSTSFNGKVLSFIITLKSIHRSLVNGSSLFKPFRNGINCIMSISSSVFYAINHQSHDTKIPWRFFFFICWIHQSYRHVLLSNSFLYPLQPYFVPFRILFLCLIQC